MQSLTNILKQQLQQETADHDIISQIKTQMQTNIQLLKDNLEIPEKWQQLQPLNYQFSLQQPPLNENIKKDK